MSGELKFLTVPAPDYDSLIEAIETWAEQWNDDAHPFATRPDSPYRFSQRRDGPLDYVTASGVNIVDRVRRRP